MRATVQTTLSRWIPPVGVILGLLAGSPATPQIAAAQSATDDADPIFADWRTWGPADGLPSETVYAVETDGDRVWIGTAGGLAVLEEGELRVVDVGTRLPFPVVTALAAVPDSDELWIGTFGGLARLSGGRIDSFTQLDSGLANDVVYGVAVEGPRIWMATAAGLSSYDRRTQAWAIYDTDNTLMHEPWCYGVTADASSVYVAVWGGGVLVRDTASGVFREHRDPDGEMEIDLFVDDGLVHDVTSAVSVAEGVLWVGTYFGLSRYDGRRWRSWNQEDSGLAGDFINTVAATPDAVWIGTDQGLSRYDGDRWLTWRRGEPPGSVDLEISAEAGEQRRQPLQEGPPSNTIYWIEVGDDAIWLATAAGLARGTLRRPVSHDSTSIDHLEAEQR